MSYRLKAPSNRFVIYEVYLKLFLTMARCKQHPALTRDLLLVLVV
jgi:hypothetical protein